MLQFSEVSIFKENLRMLIELAKTEENPVLRHFMVGGFIVSGYILNIDKSMEEDKASKSAIELDLEGIEQSEADSYLEENFNSLPPKMFITKNSYDVIILRDAIVNLGNNRTMSVAYWQGRIDHISAVWTADPTEETTRDS